MLLAADFRAIARDALKGQWLRAVGIGLLAGLMGAAIDSPTLSVDADDLETLQAILHSDFYLRHQGLFLAGGITLALYVLVCLVIGGAATLGYAKYNLDLVDARETGAAALFSQFHRLWDGFCLQFLRWLYIFLWSLLFVIPGIIASFRYSMAAYILAENPGMTAGEAITRSKEMMVGNKFRLFCLSFSFLGWVLLCMAPIFLLGSIAAGPMLVRSKVGVVVMALGTLLSYICLAFLLPYMEAANAAFYREVSGTDPRQEASLPQEIL